MVTVSGKEPGVPAPRRRQLTRDELHVWRTFLRAHAQLTRRLEVDLTREHNLDLAAYDVLTQLVEAPERRLRMTELSDLLLSRSGLTRLVDRLVEDGLVRREACETDRRGLFTVLTDAGYDRLLAVSETQVPLAIDRFTPTELHILGELLAHLIDEP